MKKLIALTPLFLFGCTTSPALIEGVNSIDESAVVVTQYAEIGIQAEIDAGNLTDGEDGSAELPRMIIESHNDTIDSVKELING